MSQFAVPSAAVARNAAPKFRLDGPTMTAETQVAFAAAIDAVEVRAKVRRSAVVDFLSAAAEVIDLANIMLMKKDQPGLVFRIDPNAQDFPGAYHSRPETTVVRLHRDKTSWYFDHPQRERCINRRIGLEQAPKCFATALEAKARATATWNTR